MDKFKICPVCCHSNVSFATECEKCNKNIIAIEVTESFNTYKVISSSSNLRNIKINGIFGVILTISMILYILNDGYV